MLVTLPRPKCPCLPFPGRKYITPRLLSLDLRVLLHVDVVAGLENTDVIFGILDPDVDSAQRLITNLPEKLT